MAINDIYKNALIELYTTGTTCKPRDMITKELLSYKIIVDNPLDNIITLQGLETNIEYANLELSWYLANTDRIDWHPKIQKIWQRYSGDGEHVNSAYGHRIFGGHPDCPNQWEYVKNTLSSDPDSRRACIVLNMPSDRIDTPVNKSDFPCTYSLNFLIRDNKLTMIANMRSNDAYFGFRNDLFCFTSLQRLMSEELNIGLGQYIHNADSFHLYEPQFSKVEKLMRGD